MQGQPASADASDRTPARPGRRALVHIGLDKTGSTAIQAWLRLNAGALRTHDVFVDLLDAEGPPALDMVRCFAMYGQAADPGWRPGQRARRQFGLGGREDVEARVADMMARAEASLPPPECGLWVASSEHLGTHLLTPAAVCRQHAWLAERFGRVDYLCYIRDPVGWAPSAWAQAVRSGSPLTLDAFIAARGARDHLGLAQRWAEAVGEDRLHLRIYDEVVRQGDVVTDFAGALGLDAADFAPVGQRNPTLGARRLRFESLRNRIRRRSRRLAPWIDRLDPLARLLDGGPRPALGARQAARVRDLNRDSDEALRAWMFPDRPTLFPGPAAQAPARPFPPIADRSPCPSS